ncbi:MAG: LLM class flavin-dependent oxidoreductase [Thermoleophilia bacterium]|nr:LLM class flavin-dependent oxidoreductase [Gaiellaceae bacterium]MDW8339738.1 LLM class flavin-dependent oxidoreductase [Thermoleophilia bacterium]
MAGERGSVALWVALPWAGEDAYYGEDASRAARRLEELGVSGVVQGDHVFLPGVAARDPRARMAADCVTTLTTIAAGARSLGVASLVSNVGLRHPLHVLRAFAQLALLYGGERVYAGLGAGWSSMEFEALGTPMPPHAERLRRLEEAAILARELFDHGFATVRGAYVNASDLPLAPAPATPPRLLLGGGSEAVLTLASRYADHVDLAPPPRLGGTVFQRPLLCTTDDLVASAGLARGGARPLTTSLLVTACVFCDAPSVPREEEMLCRGVGLSPRSLADCPYVLVGEPRRMADLVRERAERIGLDWLIVPASAAERFACEVMPLLA